jgi:uncharacterized membrane protein
MRIFFGILLAIMGFVLFLLSLKLIVKEDKLKQGIFPMMISLSIVVISIIGCFTDFWVYSVLGIIPLIINIKNKRRI